MFRDYIFKFIIISAKVQGVDKKTHAEVLAIWSWKLHVMFEIDENMDTLYRHMEYYHCENIKLNITKKPMGCQPPKLSLSLLASCLWHDILKPMATLCFA